MFPLVVVAVTIHAAIGMKHPALSGSSSVSVSPRGATGQVSVSPKNANSSRKFNLYIIRHGDKMSAYTKNPMNPDTEQVRKWSENPPRHDRRYGNNPPLSPCGFAQAEAVAEMLKGSKIRHVFTSPLFRSWQTALPMLQKTRSRNIFVENHLVEDRQLHSTDILNDYWVTGDNLELARTLMSTGDFGFNSNYDVYAYGPETDELYWNRVEEASKFFLERLFTIDSPLRGNVAMFSHASTCISLVYALCANLWDANPKKWYEDWVRHNPIGPAGFIQVSFEVSHGGVTCKSVTAVNNDANEKTECDPTPTTPQYLAKEGLCNYWRTGPEDFPLIAKGQTERKKHCKFASHH
jgi:broad specificity phosphatase PhoE